MIERMRTEPLLHRIGPLLVRDSHIPNWPSDRSPQSFDHLSYRGSFADQSVRALKRRARIGQQSSGYTGYIFRADQWNHGRILAPRQEDSTLLGDALANKSAHVFVVGWRLDMNSAHLRPVEDAIGQPMLQIAEAGCTS